jgi:hypothetical protein
MNIKTITKLAAAITCSSFMAASQALTLQVGTGISGTGAGSIRASTSHDVLGEFVPGVTGSGGAASREADVVNALRGLAPGGTGSFNIGSTGPEIANRSLNTFSPLPVATDVDALLVGKASGSGNFDVSVPAGYTYLVIQWDGPQGGLMAYDIADLAVGTVLTFPIVAYGHGQTGGSFLKSTSTSVPDGGATVALLGLGMLGLGAVRRKLS